MDRRFKALIGLLALSSASAFAGYAQLSPPTGWSSAGVTGTTAAANGATFLNGTVATNASLNVGGRAVSVPASMRLAANAPRIAAAAIMLHPGIRTAVTVASWLGVAGLVYDVATNTWTSPNTQFPISNGLGYLVPGRALIHQTQLSACNVWASISGFTTFQDVAVIASGVYGYAGCQLKHRDYGGSLTTYSSDTALTITSNTSCPSGWFITPAGCVQTPPPASVTTDEAIEELIRHPMPSNVPPYIPVPLPVERPNIVPVFVPTGDPVRNPAFDPASEPSTSNPPAIQPGIEVKPAPSASSPWQVETTPVNRPVLDPTAAPVRDPVAIPDTGGSTPENIPKDPDKTDFCEKHPTVIACQELKDEKDDIELPIKAIEFEFNPIPGFGGIEFCPAFPYVGDILGGAQISWQPFCDTLGKIKHLLLAFAWVSAAFILLGRSD